MTGELFPWALVGCRDELEDVATSVFDLMGKTEATEDQIGKMVDQIFQVPSFSACVCVCVCVCETLEKENPPLTANFQEMDGNGDGLVRAIIVIFLMLITTTTTTTILTSSGPSKCAPGDRAGVPGPLPGQALSSPLHGHTWEASGLILQICYQSD